MWLVTVMWRLESGQRPLLHHKSVLCKHTLMECKQLRGVPTKRKWALTLLDLQTVIDYYANSSSHDDLLVFVSQLLTGFFALMRLGELTVSDDKSLLDYRKITSRTSLSLSNDDYRFFLPSHKADKFFEGNIVIIQRHTGSINPLSFFKNISVLMIVSFLSPLTFGFEPTVPAHRDRFSSVVYVFSLRMT